MKRIILKSAVATAAFAVQLGAPAADLDLYTNLPTTNSSDLPNVLFVIDNTANWNTAFSNEMAALKQIFTNLPNNKFNVGIMFATETGGGNSSQKGGYVRAAIREMSAANKLLYVDLIDSFDVGADKSSGGASGMQMAEVYRYFAGGAPIARQVKADYAGNTNGGSAASNAIYALGGNALSSFSASPYNSPIVTGSCAKNYIIYISNGPNQENNSLSSVSKSLLTAVGGASAAKEIAISPSGSQNNPMDEWTRYMRKSSMAVVTYTIDVDPITTGQGPGWTALLKSTSGEENYRAVTSGNGGENIAEAVNDALSKIQSVNSVFAAVSLPASANVQGAYLNQLYVGMFRPDPDSKPRWMGNIKQYKMGTSNNLVDADGAGAINSQTGFVSECARSFWTPSKSTPDTYWINDPKGACIPSGSDAALYANSNTPDGNIVEKGAQAYMLRSGTAASRVVKTCSETFTGCTTLLDFNNTTVSTGGLGLLATDTAGRDALVTWARGANIDAELAKTDPAAMRPSSHGDVIHSNPLALSYQTGNVNDVIVYYGSNDGMLHAVNGNQTANYGSVAPGAELWAFMPPEFFPHLSRLRANTEIIKITPPVDSTSSGSDKPYSMDGPITAYRSGSISWLYATMRRGGRALYAFDVSTPSSPTLKFKIGCGDTTDLKCSTGATGMGQTWSAPRPTKAVGYTNGDTPAPMIIMGGGYDTCEDTDVNTCTTTSKGNKVFVLDAATGAILKTLDTLRPVVADIKMVPDANGYAKYGYVADLGGNIYRINMGTAAPAAWTLTQIASLGCADATTPCTSNRKFMFAPSVVAESDGSYSLYLGTGDREKPLGPDYFPNTSAVANYFFKIKDKPDDATWLSAESAVNCPGKSMICLASLVSAGNVAATCGAAGGIADGKGWALGLRATEQVVTTAATLYGVTTFSTHMPAVASSGVCGSNLGTVHVYNIDIDTATPSAGTTCSDVVTGGGLPPPPKKPKICIDAACEETVTICIGCSTNSPIELQPNEVPASLLGSNAKRRVYWYQQQ